MTRSVVFTAPGEPRGKGRPRAFKRGKGIALYTDDKTAAYENLVRICYSEAAKGQPPMTGPVWVVLTGYWSVPKSAPKKARAEMLAGHIKVTKKPDLDNVIKAVLDGLNGVAFADDAQVFRIHAGRSYSETPRLEVEIIEVYERKTDE